MNVWTIKCYIQYDINVMIEQASSQIIGPETKCINNINTTQQTQLFFVLNLAVNGICLQK